MSVSVPIPILPYNFCGLDKGISSFEDSLFVILPVPYDCTSTYQSGSRRGPMAIIDASTHIELYDEELDIETYKEGIHTMPFLEPTTAGPKEMSNRVYDASIPIIEANKLPVLFGGEHSLSLGLVRAIKEHYNRLSVLQLDAHADLRDTYQASPFNHACVARRISEIVPLTQVGIRSLSREERDFINDSEIKTFFANDLKDTSLEDICNTLTEDVFITIDLDVLDPSIMPSTGTPEPGGLYWYEILNIIKLVAVRRRVVGFDIVEMCPIPGNIAPDFLAAKLAYRMMGYIVIGKS